MRTRSFVLLTGVWCLCSSLSNADDVVTTLPERIQFAGARTEIYKRVGDVDLALAIFSPENRRPKEQRPAIVFFFGGGWRGGSPGQFEHQCRYLASRGMVAITVDYRVRSRHDVRAVSCVSDAKSAIRWVRGHAADLGIDPNRIVASGGSAGGHLAACTALITEFDEPNEDVEIKSVPNALVLFNPAVVLAPVEGKPSVRDWRDTSERTGVEPIRLSPYHHVRSGAPPTLILHGRADITVPYRSVEWFTEQMVAQGNRCELEGYAGATHGFFNFSREKGRNFVETIERVDHFLVSLGYLSGKPTAKDYLKSVAANPE